MTVFEGFQLTLNCDFVAVADRKYCQVFYGRERLLDEDVATYSFADDVSFQKALKTATVLSNTPTFEKLWSAKQFDDRPGGYICLKRKRGDSFLYHLHQAHRTQQFKYCIKLVKALLKIHEQGRPHGGLDEDNVIFDERLKSPYLLEVLSGFYADQLDPQLCAPEQKDTTPATFATDVFWLGNLYLSAIKRPSHKLRQLVKRCRAADPAKRPQLKEVAATLQDAYTQDLEISMRRWLLRPQRSIQLAGLGLLASAAFILGFDLVEFNQPAPEPSFQETLQRNLERTTPEMATLGHIRSLLDKAETEDQVKFAIDSLVDKASATKTFAEPVKKILKDRFIDEPISQNREELISGISEITFSHDSLTSTDNWTTDDFDASFIGVMIFDWPLLITQNGVYELGDWILFDGVKGYISRISMNQVLVKNGPEIQKIDIATPRQLTKIDWQGQNVYIRGQRSNMHHVIRAFEKWGFDIIEMGKGQTPGYISGYFTFRTPQEFLKAVEPHLDLTFDGKTIWVQDIQRLRTYIPIENYSLDESSCADVFSNLLQFTGIDFRVDPSCDSPLYFHATKMELKEVIKSLGYTWSLDTQPGTFEVTFFRKD